MSEPGPTVRDVQAVYERSFQAGVVAGLMGVLRARDDEIARLRACLEGMAWQFGHPFERDGQHYLGTLGRPALEHAVAALGWEAPHPYDPDAGRTKPDSQEDA